MNSKASAGEFTAKREGSLVAAQKTWNNQHRLAVLGSPRPALAECREQPSEVPGQFRPVLPRRRGRIVAGPDGRVRFVVHLAELVGQQPRGNALATLGWTRITQLAFGIIWTKL